MKIYYSFPLQELKQNASKYHKVIDFLKQNEHELTREWLDDALKHIENNRSQPSRAEMYSEVMAAIRSAKVCIFDVTVKSMSVGQQILYALERRKPTLMISNIHKSDPVYTLMIYGSGSGYLHAYDYRNEVEMLKIIETFLSKPYIIAEPQRYNLLLERELSEFVNWKGFQEGITKTEVIAQAVREYMQNDSQYQDFQDYTSAKNKL
jgi:hypothetical protein